jgi:CheY-like chemotaxis protein
MNRILVVDDEPIIRMLLVESLVDAGYAVTTARNGAEALDVALEHRSDVVLLDLLMPGTDGLTFLRERQAHPDLAKVPVVVLSAAGIEGLREASRLRATAVLAKPLDLDVLSAVIQHVLREWSDEPPVPETPGRPIGTCPICEESAYAEVSETTLESDRVRAVHIARLRHVLAHSAADIARVPMRMRLLQLPSGRRGTLAKWLYHELRRDWGDQDRRSVHSIDAALDSPSLHRLWQDATRCGWPSCRHDA